MRFNRFYKLPFLAAALLMGGCNHSSDYMSRFHEDGRAKPVTAIASMIDTTSFDAPWSLSEEFTSSITSSLGQTGKIFVVSKEEEALAANPFGKDLSWVKREFPRQEFVVFMELVEHELVPASKQKKESHTRDSSSNLNVAVRLRVIDVRSNEPSIVLQEIVKDSYFIPKSLIPTDYNIATWGTSEFKKSPMGIAHSSIVQEISTRISDYILLAKSR